MYSMNVILLSYRSTEIARRIFLSCCKAVGDLSGVKFSFGYGGGDPDDLLYYKKVLNNLVDTGAETRLVVDASLPNRLAACLDTAKDWTVLVADDDLFSENYLASFAETSLKVASDVSMILPDQYNVIDGARRCYSYNPPGVVSEKLNERYVALLGTRLSGLGFYSAHRTTSVSRWLDFWNKKKFYASYSDQLLVTLGVVTGSATTTGSGSFLEYDQSNWATPERCFDSDARCYPKRELVLFHELFWCVDMISILEPAPDFEEMYVSHFNWWRKMLRSLVSAYPQRVAHFQFAPDKDIDGFVSIIKEFESWMQKVEYLNQAAYIISELRKLSAEIERRLLKESV
jgi:hypothetical protein